MPTCTIIDTFFVFQSVWKDVQHCLVDEQSDGWLWGSVRYATGMIYLLIIPIHFAYNSVWLLFEGNWSNPPVWSIYALPIVEFLIGIIVVNIKNIRRLA